MENLYGFFILMEDAYQSFARWPSPGVLLRWGPRELTNRKSGELVEHGIPVGMDLRLA